MCDPVSASLSMMGTSTIMGAQGAHAEAEAQKNAAEFNAQVSIQKAQDAMNRAQSDVDKIRVKGNQVKGEQIAAMAANGIRLDGGSALEILSQTEKLVDLDVEQAFENGRKEAQGFRTQSILEQNKADSISPNKAAFSSLLGGATQMAGSYASFKAAGAI